MYDASEPLHMLYAHATYANNKLTYHFKDAWIEQQAIDLTPQGVSFLFNFGLIHHYLFVDFKN